MIFSALPLFSRPVLPLASVVDPDRFIDPHILFSPPPPPVAPLVLTSFSTLLQGQAKPKVSFLEPQTLFRITNSPDLQLAQQQQQSVQSAIKEWQSGVKETHGENRSPRIDQYARKSQFGPGYAWCGFFVAFNYSQAGFTQAPHLASSIKARDFFLYRQVTDRSRAKNQALNQLQEKHQQAGSQRQYFMLNGSDDARYVRSQPSLFGHIQLQTYRPDNLPIRPGDTVIFTRGHVGMVTSYNPQTGILQTIEGNTSGRGPNGRTWHNAVVKKEYNLKNPAVQKQFGGFGRPALDDFMPANRH